MKEISSSGSDEEVTKLDPGFENNEEPGKDKSMEQISNEHVGDDPLLDNDQQFEQGSGDALENVEIESPKEAAWRDTPCQEFREQFPGEYTNVGIDTFELPEFSDPRDVVTDINPNVNEGKSFQTNCCDCSRSFERTWRGNYEEAAGRVEERGESRERTAEWAGRDLKTVPLQQVHDRLAEGGHGSSAIVISDFSDPDEYGVYKPGSHAYNAVNYNGQIRVVDAQYEMVSPWSESTGHPWIQNPVLDGRFGHVDTVGWNAQNEPLWRNEVR